MTTTQFIQPTSGSPGGVNTVRACASGQNASPTDIKLDIIFALDASQAMGADDYETVSNNSSLLEYCFSRYNIKSITKYLSAYHEILILLTLLHFLSDNTCVTLCTQKHFEI
jgi:hypothetical protein